jgi:hypothetical protein
LTVAALEGATLIARTERRADALKTVTAMLEAQVRAHAPIPAIDAATESLSGRAGRRHRSTSPLLVAQRRPPTARRN